MYELGLDQLCSTMCRSFAVGHEETATFHNKLGGSSRVYSERENRVPC